MSDPPPAPEQQQPPAQRQPWREPVRGGYPDPRMLALSGLEQLRAMIDEEVPAPPISRLTGMRLVAADDGTATFQMPLTRWLCSPQGPISIGPLAIPADAAVACAIQTQLPPATPFTTSELSLRLLSPVGPGGTIAAHGRLIQVRRKLALAEVTLTGEQSRLIGHGSSLCFIGPQISPAPEPLPAVRARSVPPAAPGPGQEPPDPFECPAPGEVLGRELWERLSGLEVLRLQLRGELPAPPIHHLTGLTLTSASPDGVTFTMPASEWLCAPARRRVQGGALALLAEAALGAAIQATLPAGTALALVDLKVNYLRALTADGAAVRAHGRVVHAGRRIAVASAEVEDANGNPIAVASGSAMLLVGREPSLGTREP